MRLSKQRRNLRRNNARQAARYEKTQKYLIDRQKQPMFPLAEALANELGDIPAGTMITQAEFKRCLWRLADIRAGKVKRPNTAPEARTDAKHTVTVGSGSKPL
jgi:hypothetical protein